MIRAGLLGAARIAPKAFLAPAKARGDIDIVAVGCREAAKAESFITGNDLISAKAANYAQVCTDPSIDIVYCALPPSAHVKWVVMALEHGKAVLCEKPFAMNAEQAREMTAAARRAGSLLMEGYHYAFHPAFHFVREQIKAGAIGTPEHFRGEFAHHIENTPGELRYARPLGGGALMDLGCYPLHAFRSLFGEPQITRAQAARESGVDVSMQAGVQSGDVTGDIICDMSAAASGRVLFEVSGSLGTLRFNNFIAPHNGHTITITKPGESRLHVKAGITTYRAQLDDFIGAFTGQSARLSPRDAEAQMTAIDAIYAAAGF